jgi:hypothetical protein
MLSRGRREREGRGKREEKKREGKGGRKRGEQR